MASYTVDQIMACLDQLDLEPVLITSLETKRSIKARVVYAASCKKGQKMKGLVVLEPDAPRVTADTTCSAVEIARAAAEDGITPIEVMLGAMRDLWGLGTPESKREAAEIAKDAAPYIHPRLASIDQTLREDRPFALIREVCSSVEEWEATYRPTLEHKKGNE